MIIIIIMVYYFIYCVWSCNDGTEVEMFCMAPLNRSTCYDNGPYRNYRFNYYYYYYYYQLQFLSVFRLPKMALSQISLKILAGSSRMPTLPIALLPKPPLQLPRCRQRLLANWQLYSRLMLASDIRTFQRLIRTAVLSR